MHIALLQLNLVVGDVAGNAGKIHDAYMRSVAAGAELVVATELALLGYPPRDLLLRRDVVRAQMEALDRLAGIAGNVPLAVGFAEPNLSGRGKGLFNALAVLRDGRVAQVQRKSLLPTYDVFDEHRYFEPYRHPQPPARIDGREIAFLICEDIWGGIEDADGAAGLLDDPVRWVAESRPDGLVVVNGSPYWWGKGDRRCGLVADVARRVAAPVLFVNQVGGNDELIFDGRSFAVDAEGRPFTVGRAFAEEMLLVDTAADDRIEWPADTGDLTQLEEALRLGLRDYVEKLAAFPGGALVGVSGGLDSALVARLAVAALGAESVVAVTMPSPFSSAAGLEDAHAVARNLRIELREVPIGALYDGFASALRPQIGWEEPPSVTEENVQARIRATLLMAMANREQRILLGTGNKSEIAMGYSTLYGDMAAGLGVISDLPKTLVQRLTAHLNRTAELTPRRVLSKPPSAELRPGQLDTDSLPPYGLLDPVLEAHIDLGMGRSELIDAGFDPDLVRRVLTSVQRAEFKRRQMAPGLKVTTKAFGSGRRMPIAAAPP